MESVTHTPPARLPDSRASPATPSQTMSSSTLANRRINSRKRLRSLRPRTTAPDVLQPSINPTTSKLAGPPFPIRASDLKRQLQLQPITPKSELIKPGRRGDNKPRPYELEPPPQAQNIPKPAKGPESKAMDIYARDHTNWQ